MGGLLTDTRLETFTRLHDAYPDGVFVRLPTRRMLVIGTSGAIRHVLVDGAANYAKGVGQADAAHLLGDGILTAEGERWAMQRRGVEHALASPRLRSLATQIDESAQQHVDLLTRDAAGSTNLKVQLAQYALDCLTLTLNLDPIDADPISRALDILQGAAMRACVTNAVRASNRPPQWGRASRARRLLRAHAHACLTTSADAPQWLDEDGLASLILAGYETTASTLHWVAHYLAIDAAAQARLAEETDRVDLAAPLHLRELPWTRAVIAESTRLRPPVWCISRRAKDHDSVGGHHVRPGDDVVITVHAIQREGWTDPEAFLPERHLRDPQGRYVAFGRGPRSCPGRALADAEATAWLTHASRALTFSSERSFVPRPHARLSQTPPADARITLNARTV